MTVPTYAKTIGISTRKLEFMLSVARHIGTEDINHYKKVAAQSNRILSERVLELIAPLKPHKRRKALETWAKQNLSVRSLEDWLGDKRSTSANTTKRKRGKKQPARGRVGR